MAVSIGMGAFADGLAKVLDLRSLFSPPRTRGPGGASAVWGLVGLALAGCLAAGSAPAWAAGRTGPVILYDRESRYYRIRVEEHPEWDRRYLYFSKTRGVQSSMILSAPEALDFEYTRSMAAALALHPEPKEVLLVGLGGASLPKFIQRHFPDLRLDIVELDPDVLKVSGRYFQFKPGSNTRIFVMDGRLYLKRSEKKYDVILLDAYAGDRIPLHLTTAQFLRLLKARLNPGGIVAANLWEPVRTRFYFAELKTYQENFPQTYLFKAGRSDNVVIFGAMDAKKVERAEWADRASGLAGGKALDFNLTALVRAEYGRLTDFSIPEIALTDERAPVDTLRREHPKYFEKEQPPP